MTMAIEAGDVVLEGGLHTLAFSPSVNVTKGQVVKLSDGTIAVASSEGPFGVAIDDCLSTETKAFAVAPTTIYLTYGTNGATAYDYLQAATAGTVETLSGKSYEGYGVGCALETATVGQIKKVRLGMW